MADTSPPPGGADRKGPRQVRSGDALGRYEIGEELGEGGMATVFRARDRELRREVALKVLFPHLARRSEIVRRFHREARAAAGLEHPNILRIYDVGGGEADDPPYIVMELVRGRTLLQEIEARGAMLAEIAACIGALLGDALAAAHAAGIIHRDVKPANVLIAPGGRLLLADFGVARLETEDSLVTRTGALLGTPAYMSPEQAGGETAIARSDVYSLGATLYQLATGGLPYSGSAAKVMSQIAAGTLVPPVRRKPSCGPDLSRLIERMMAREPEGRPASAIAVAAELRALAAAGGLGDPSEELAAYFEDPDGFLRTRTPTVVTALVAAARSAVAGARLPRAMALADRASALAPDEPAVAALVQTVTDGGRASRRNRGLALGGIAFALAGGITAAALRLAGTPATDGAAAGSTAEADSGSGTEAVSGTGTEAVSGSGSGTGTEAVSGSGTEAVSGSGTEVVSGSRADPVAATTGSATPGARTAGSTTGSPAGSMTGSPTATDGSATMRGEQPRAGDPGGARASTSISGPGDAAKVPAPAGRAQNVGSTTPPSARTQSAAPAAMPAMPLPGAAPTPPGSTTPGATQPPGDGAGSGDVRAGPAVQSEAVAHVVVRNDLWCKIWIDGVDRGNRRNEPLEVTAGHHVVRCVNPAGEWKQEIDIAAGATRTLTGSLMRELEVTLAVDAEIDGKRYRRGAVVKLKPGNVEVIVGGKKQFITFRASCTLTDVPALGCYL